jgi:osmoprotectant transport system permease protein
VDADWIHATKGGRLMLFVEALTWLTNPETWQGRYGLATLIAEHLRYSLIALLVAAIIAIPIGYLIGHTGKGIQFAVGVSGAARALPSLGLVLLLVLLVGVLRVELAATVAFVLLGIPPILAGAYAGLQNVDRRTIDAARAVGMTEWQILWRVEVPLGLPLLMGGLRSAALQIVATVTIAAYVNLGALGHWIIAGIPLRRYDYVLGSALLVVALALLVDALFAIAQRASTPRGLRGRATKTRGGTPSAAATAEAPAT